MGLSDLVLWAFVIVIGTFCLYAAVVGLRHIRRYNGKETANLSRVLDALDRIADESPGLVPVQDLLDGMPGETIIADRLELIGKMRASRVKVNIGALQQMTLAREASLKGLNLPGYAANTAMMLGLLGTVVGLTAMLQNMSGFQPLSTGSIDLASWSKSIEAINRVMASMKMGFGATMAGLASAIALSTINHRLAAAQSSFFNKLERATAKNILPATVPATEDESLLEQVSLQLEKSFSELSHLAEENKDAMDRVEALRKGFLEIVDVVRQSNRTDNTDRIVGLVAKLGGVMDQVSRVSQSMVQIGSGFPSLLEKVETASSGPLARVDKLIEMYEQQHSLYEQQRSLMNWPYPIKVALGFMACLNVILLIYALTR